MADTAPAPEELLLREALELDAAAGVLLLSREPLGHGSVAGFDVSVGEEPSMAYFVDTSRRVVPVETGLAMGADVVTEAPVARVWLHPADPHLPALAPIAFSHAAEALMARLGLTPTAAPVIVAYRPGRRAVLRVETTTGCSWLKVVPPARLERIVRTHRALADHGVAVPALRGWSPDGLLVIDDAPGAPVTDADWSPDRLLDEVDLLRNTFADVPFDVPARTGLGSRLGWYADRLRDVVDDDRFALVQAVVDASAGRAGDTADGAAVGIHGDLHFGQLFLDADHRISAVIDVDTAGSGAPAADAAAFVGHAIASALLTPQPRDRRVWELARSAYARWDEPATASGAFRVGTATHLLGHALGARELGETVRADRLLRLAAAVVAGERDGWEST